MNVPSLGPSGLQTAQRAAFGALGASVLAVAFFGLRLVRLRGEVKDLRLQTKARKERLIEDRKATGDLPKGPKPDALDRSRAVAKLRNAITTLATQRGFSVEEFQAVTQEAPYLTAYASDSQDPGWMQVPIKVALKGRSTVLLSAIQGLRRLDVPFEIDTLELTRRSTDDKGMATVAAQVSMRALVYRGEG